MGKTLQQQADHQQPVQYGLSENVLSVSKQGMAEQSAWKLWETLAEIYGNRWVTKNGLQPSTLWIAQISGMTVEQLQAICSRLVQRCSEGNSWPPDLAEFVSLAAVCSGGTLGLTGEDVTAEYKRWKNESWRYNSSEEFPWRHPVLYHICVEMRRECIQRKLSQPEMDKLAAVKLTRWEKKLQRVFRYHLSAEK